MTALNAWQARHDRGLLMRQLRPGEPRRYMVGIRHELHMSGEAAEGARVLAERLNCGRSVILGLALERGAQLADGSFAARYPEYRQLRDALATLPRLGMADVWYALGVDPPRD